MPYFVSETADGYMTHSTGTQMRWITPVREGSDLLLPPMFVGVNSFLSYFRASPASGTKPRGGAPSTKSLLSASGIQGQQQCSRGLSTLFVFVVMQTILSHIVLAHLDRKQIKPRLARYLAGGPFRAVLATAPGTGVLSEVKNASTHPMHGDLSPRG